MLEENPPRLSFEGPDALLIDGAMGAFSDAVQEKIWALAEGLRAFPGMIETVPGMNNLLLVFDPFLTDVDQLQADILTGWRVAGSARQGVIRDVPVRYGGEDGPDLEDFARAKGMTADEVIARHTAPLYSVAAVGAMPGFVYLSGLDPQLAAPRLSNPRDGVPVGSVIVGGAQAGIMPVTAPSGWHILGRTDLSLFDATRDRPALFAPGDRLRFVPEAR
ncbi:5-oxoprolinase subunit PxpB [Rhizobium sp. G21]|uniref:5-oxoprolinase subunit PxpB n=1 Tax=Rhizobium sp. G21 TaxID=2758439 RepID=UPI001600C921|nr:5-oxoprolinase subunit PxpB [Rhizobium sp. G21]MBB1249284.1 5-oxoprolinase subunit PxpB [Rhizobium sp. G21]